MHTCLKRLLFAAFVAAIAFLPSDVGAYHCKACVNTGACGGIPVCENVNAPGSYNCTASCSVVNVTCTPPIGGISSCYTIYVGYCSPTPYAACY